MLGEEDAEKGQRPKEGCREGRPALGRPCPHPHRLGEGDPDHIRCGEEMRPPQERAANENRMESPDPQGTQGKNTVAVASMGALSSLLKLTSQEGLLSISTA